MDSSVRSTADHLLLTAHTRMRSGFTD
jgi:hypothetical protein